MLTVVIALVASSCASIRDGCLCYTNGTTWARVGTVELTDAGTAVLGGTTFGAGAPAEAPISGVDAGTTALITSQGALPVGSNGRVVCGIVQQIDLDALDYAKALGEQRCDAQLVDAGFAQPPCNDSGCGCSSAVTPLSLALIAIVIRSMKRRRADL